MSDVLPPNGIGSSNDGGTPPPPPPTASVPAQGGSSNWYENIAIVIIALFCCSPLGLVLVWINKKWTTKTKAIVTAAVIAIAILGAIAGAASSGSSSSSSADSKPTVTTVAKNSDSGSSSESKNTTTTAQAAVACKDTPDETSLDTKNQSLYPQRLGTAKDDHEAAVGDCVRIDGMTAYVLDAQVLTPRFGDKVIVVKVKIRGRDGTKTYNPFDFKLQTTSGNQESITIALDDSINELGSGSLVKGGEVTGDLVFEYQGPGTYYVVWEPSIINDEKGIWALNVP